jgi:flagellar biogenesis protein FliO
LPAEALLSVAAVKSLTPSTRVAVVRFAGRDHLVGICGASVQLLATSMPEPPPPPAIDAESAA